MIATTAVAFGAQIPDFMHLKNKSMLNLLPINRNECWLQRVLSLKSTLTFESEPEVGTHSQSQR